MISTPTTINDGFTDTERASLECLRRRYEEDPDVFADRERARLEFVRWLHRTGRVES